MKSLLVATILIAVPLASFSAEMDAAATNALLAKIATARDGRSVTADFTERKFLPMMNDPIEESGTIAFEPPDKFLRRTTGGTLAVSDGRTLWMHYPQFQQVEVYPLDDARGPGALFAMLRKVFQLDGLDGQFRVKAFPLENGYRLELVPRAGSLRRLVSSIDVEIDSSLRLRSSVMQGTGGDRIETAYTSETFVPAGSTVFTFTPPPGANVVKPLGR